MEVAFGGAPFGGFGGLGEAAWALEQQKRSRDAMGQLGAMNSQNMGQITGTSQQIKDRLQRKAEMEQRLREIMMAQSLQSQLAQRRPSQASQGGGGYVPLDSPMARVGTSRSGALQPPRSGSSDARNFFYG